MARVQTVLGDKDPGQLGVTLMHEHIAFNGYERSADGPPYDWREVVEVASRELAEAVSEGVETLVEVTPIGNERSPGGMAEISARTDLNIVASTGFWCDPPLEALVGTDDVGALVELMSREITVGMGGTNIKAGIIKIATSERMTSAEEKVFRAAARASRKTGAAITTHTQRGALALEQIDLLASEGADLARVVIGHVAGRPDLDLHVAVARRGAYLGYDRTGQGHEQDDDAAVILFAEMVRRGFTRQLLVSQDTSVYLFGVRRAPLPRHLGGHSLHERPAYTHIWHRFIPRVHALGVTDEDMRTVLVDNPARLLPLDG